MGADRQFAAASHIVSLRAGAILRHGLEHVVFRHEPRSAAEENCCV